MPAVHGSNLRGPMRALMVIVLIVAAVLPTACRQRPQRWVLRGEALGTFYTITLAEAPKGMTQEAAKRIVSDTLDRVNLLMSTYRDDSELSRFNRHASPEPFPVSEETWKVFDIARTISEQSGGAFDVTVGPLVNAWGFGPEAFEVPPDEDRVRALLERTGYEQLTLHPGPAVAKTRPDIYCDLSGIAKGYAVDAVAEALEEAGVTRYMVEIGGDLRVAGDSPRGAAWVIGIEAPEMQVRELYTAVHISEGALATSGDYRTMYELDGRYVSHTIDPHTGYPVQHGLASVSVIHPSCTWADGYATALFALGPEKAEALAREQGLSVLLLVRDPDTGAFTAITTPGFDACLQGRLPS